jgi:hypothetical protein
MQTISEPQVSQSPLQSKSDKSFWHKYTSFYAKTLEGIDPNEEFDILEIGVFNSKSIFQWRQSFPNSNITGCDINNDLSWFKDEKVKYLQFDQSDADALKKSIQCLHNPRILIDDGSHIPFHQLIFLHIATSMVTIFPLAQKRVVIVEDLHTSLEQIILDQSQKTILADIKRIARSGSHIKNPYECLSDIINPMGMLLSLEKVMGGSQSMEELIDQVSLKTKSPALLTLAKEIITNCLKADKIRIFKRSTLPDLCWKCGSNLFDPATLRCQGCGENGYKYADSITASLEYNCSNL